MKVQWSGGSRSFAKERLKNEEHRGWPLELDNNWEPSLKLILLQLQKLPKNSMLTTLWSFGIWRGSERWKSLISGCLVSWLKIKKPSFWCHLLLIYTTRMNNFSIGLWCALKSGFYATTGDDQLSGGTEKKLQSTPKSQTCTRKKVMVTVRWSAAGLIHYSLLNPSETITSEKYAQQINEMHWKL